jgi:valyl-tRNA synthetase
MMEAMKLPKLYEAGLYESDVYSLWEKSGVFQPRPTGKPYSIVMPPPNANAKLHIGYELTGVLEDIAARYHRLKGESVLLLPGADHAGFETQSVYEKQLAREGKSRFDFSREQLYRQIWDFVALNKGDFENQMRQMGVSCDWSRFTFTLDDKIVRRAYATFQKMWQEGLIYRGERLVNFCTFHGTAFADIEVVYRQTKGHLWHIRYPLVDGSGEVVVATTRPETMLGDTAVAVNPKDKRYKSLAGKTVRLPLTNREIPIITDDYVDMKFGTGAVKITPAHDPNDYDIGKRHDLPFVSVISTEGKLIDVPEQYRGLTVEEGREKVVNDLAEQGFLVKTEPHIHNVGHCYKCDTVIQPLLREQWFIDMKPLAQAAIKVLRDGKISFYPDSKKDQLITYLEGLHDWNISRQIAWGIPIPAFQNIDDPDDWIYDERAGQETITVGGKTYRRDPDVFDTWFSSSSWPYATLGYPDNEDYKRFYPTSLMETGGEILYPWVSRMVMLGLYVTGKIPFEEVYIHGYIMAEDGSKMSKSLGNVVDPIPVIEKYGSDALRMGIIAGRAAAVNRGYDHRKVEEARNFANKLWNVARYIEGIIGDEPGGGAARPTTAADHWILYKLQRFQDDLVSDLDKYRFAAAYERLYHFIWDDLADWYVEASKSEPNRPLLAHVLEQVLLLAHPFAPFVTETIWQTLDWEHGSVLAARTLAKPLQSDSKQAQTFEDLKAMVSEARYYIKALKASDVTLHHDSDFLQQNAAVIKHLAGLKAVTRDKGREGLKLTNTSYPAQLDIDMSKTQAYAKELATRIKDQAELIKKLESRLSNDSYTKNAPADVVEQTRQQLASARELYDTLEAEAKRFRTGA